MASKAIGFLNFKFGADLSGFDRAMKKAQKNLKKFGKSVARTGKSLTTGLTLPIVALGAASLKTFADFEQSMLKVKAISGATESDFKALTDSAKELGSSTMFTATQVSELQLNLSKLGLTPKEINKSTQAILNLAQATDSDLAQAATVGASTMNAFGLEAEDMTMITDVMADAFSSTALDLEKFQTAMASVAPVAAQAGQDIQGTSAILGVLVNNGIEASSAGTALRNVFLELANKGLTWDQAMIKIQTSMNPLKTAMDLFGKRGAAVATIIANNGTEIQNLTEDFRDSSGEAQSMADIMDSGVAGSFRRMKSQLEGVAIELGTHLVPAFNALIGYIESGVKWFTSLSDSQKKNIVKWGLLVAAIGPVLIIIGKISIGISALIPVIGGVGTAFKSLYKTMLKNPFIAVGALITGLILKLTYFSNAAITARDEQEKLYAVMDNRKAERQTTKDIREKITLWKTLSRTQQLALVEQIKGHKETLSNGKLEINQQGLRHEGVKKLKAEIKSYQDLMKTDVRTVKDPLQLAQLASAPQFVKKLKNQLANLNKTIGGGKGVIEFNSEIKTMDKWIEKLSKRLDDSKTPLINVDNLYKELTKDTKEVTEETKEYDSSLDPLLANIKDYAENMTVAGAAMEGVETWTRKLTDAQQLGAAGFQMFGDILTSSLDSALDNQENFFKVFIKNIKRAIRSLLVQLAVMTLIQAIMPFGMGGMGKSAFKMSNIKSNLMGLMNIPGLAEGGLVTSPTTALIGEGVGTTASNPEVVAPLDKLKSMMGGGNQNITVTGKLIGNDIFLSNSKAGINRLRTV